MNKSSIFIVIGLVVVLVLVALLAFRPETEEVAEKPEIIVRSLAVNGITDPQVVLTMADKSVITAVIENPGLIEAEIMMSVRMNGELFDRRHDWTYVLGPGEVKEVREVREAHHTWYPGVFTVEIGDRVIEVTVRESLVE